MAFKKCRNEGCEVLIEVRNTAEGWRPFEESGNKHNCQFSDYAKKQRGEKPINGVIGFPAATRGEDKDDHGNEEFNGTTAKGPNLEFAGPELKYVDHTAKGASKVKIFYAPGTEVLEEQYNNFLKINNGQIKVQGGQFQIRDGGFAIALYYEETKQ
jgi:hypothetical protein